MKSAIEFIRDTGVMEEYCFHYEPHDSVMCDEQCAYPDESMSILGYSTTNGANQDGEYYLKRNLIVKGPQTTQMAIWGHGISMVGFGKIKVGDLILDGNIAPNQTEILIEKGNTWIGKTYWIFKESWGGWGQNNIILPKIQTTG